MTDSTSISPLRQRMIEDMTARGLSRPAQRGHILACKRFAAYLKRSPDTATAEDVRLFQLQLMQNGLSIQTRNRTMTGVRFLLRVTMRRHDLAAEVFHMKEPQKNPQILSAGEAKRLLTMACKLQVRMLLSIGYGAGLRVSEVVKLKVKHIDSALGIIRVEQGKGKKDRQVMLSPETLGLLREWWKVRKTRYDAGVPAGERWLFPGRRQGRPLTQRQVSRLFHEAVEAAGIKKKPCCWRVWMALSRRHPKTCTLSALSMRRAKAGQGIMRSSGRMLRRKGSRGLRPNSNGFGIAANRCLRR
jgi:site-specific recombinase XerD